MKSESQKKTQEAIKAENKKPPQIPSKEDNIEETKAILKDHIHGDTKEDRKLSTNQIPSDSTKDNNEQPNINTPSLLITDTVPEGKVLINIKPREDYLKDKMLTSNLNEEIIKGVNKGLELTIKNIENEIKQNTLPIPDTSKDLTEYLHTKSTEKQQKTTIELHSRNNIIRELKAQENQLKSNIYLLNENQKLLENEGYLNLTTNPNNISVIDENIRKNHVKEIKQSKENLMQKLDEIAFQIKELMAEENKDNKKLNIKAFLDNFERDKEIAEARAKKYEEEASARRQKLEKDISQLVERKKLELDAKEQEEELQRELRVKKQRKKEKELAERRTKENNQKLLKIKVFINDKPPENVYVYQEKEREYMKQEEKRIQTEANKRREKMRHVSKEECDQFTAKFNENKLKTQVELAEKALQLNELWKERKDLLPKYTSHFFTIVENEQFKSKENEELKQLQVQSNAKLRKDFGEQIMETHKPSINPKLKKERLERKSKKKIKRWNKTAHSNSDYKSIDNNNGSNGVKSEENQPKPKTKVKVALKPLTSEVNSKKKPKPLGNSSSYVTNKKKIIPEKPFDYLPEMRKKRELESERLKRNGHSVDSNEKWNKLLNQNKRSLYENVETLKYTAEKLEKEAKQKEQFLKLNGGAEKYPEIGEKVSILLIDSIQAKLCILNSVSKPTK